MCRAASGEEGVMESDLEWGLGVRLRGLCNRPAAQNQERRNCPRHITPIRHRNRHRGTPECSRINTHNY